MKTQAVTAIVAITFIGVAGYLLTRKQATGEVMGAEMPPETPTFDTEELVGPEIPEHLFLTEEVIQEAIQARLVSVSVPAQVKSGGEFLTEVTVSLPVAPLFVYIIQVFLSKGRGDISGRIIEPAEVSSLDEIASCKFMDPKVLEVKVGHNAVPLDHSRDYSFTSFVNRNTETGQYYLEPSTATMMGWRTWLPRVPLAPGIYAVTSQCKFKKISSYGATWTKYDDDFFIWRKLDTGIRVRVV